MTEIGRALRTARLDAGLSLQGMAVRTNYSKPYLGQLETGARVVRQEHVTAYESALGISLSSLYTRLPVVTRDEGDLSIELSAFLRPILPTSGAEPRQALAELIAAERMAKWARGLQWSESAPPRRAVIDWLEANLPRLRQLSPGTGQAEQALRVGAELADIAAAMSWDVEDTESARRFYLGSARLAHTAGDAGLTAAALAGLALQYLDQGRPGDGLEVAQLAQFVARRSATPRLRGTLAHLQATAYGIVGDTAAFERETAYATECHLAAAAHPSADTAIDRSLTALNLSLLLGPRRTWPSCGRQSELLGPGYRHLVRTRPRLAGAAFGMDRTPLPANIVHPAMSMTSLARLHLMLGEPDRAAELAGDALTLAGPRIGGRTAARLRDFHHESIEFAGVSGIRTVRAAIEEITTRA
ncbi:helix-turn-helix domain-containing protein [Nocardia huaxiensis]|uniref:Helix-turn-helix transcriptional regulator n=1 Tax=Nocardia huaxiensis TaxID=2755382 RepID=A0A7D6ZJN4_9NOCA|nr:helix-turn-helix transcriptional regulator [Nocardia huaxiensis]QLY32699.1 helix-turn-helix transcriptional regulator [Nocardia huaxiensis]UFS93565.1 helix-turn-helix domain-containing protein [Nocardia huaxiensis]